VPAEFSSDDLLRLARLARIELTEAERVLFGPQLARILEYARTVQQIDTTDVPPTSHPLGTAAPMRADERHPSLARDEIMAQAPEADPGAGLFKVPRVLG
jgi:aspartyl-tRNA(Asn)/glutamyl-tRNA(Gln) amidotransferase subunit C